MTLMDDEACEKEKTRRVAHNAAANEALVAEIRRRAAARAARAEGTAKEVTLKEV